MRTQATLTALVQALQTNCGDLFAACSTCMVSLQFVNQWMKDDEDVRTQLTEAERVGALALQTAAIQRAVHGTEKGVYFKGELVATEKQYSDGLLTTLLKARLPDTFGAEAAGGNVFNGPTQINIMPRANSYEEWLGMKDATLKRRDELDAADLAKKLAPPVTIDLEAIPVPVSPLAGLGL